MTFANQIAFDPPDSKRMALGVDERSSKQGFLHL
jgi:hypothetical protein